MEYKCNTHLFINREDFQKRYIDRYIECRLICITGKFKSNNMAK